MNIISVYEMKDGTLCRSKEQAREHVSSKLSKILGKALMEGLNDPRFKNSMLKREDIVNLMLILLEDYDKAGELIESLYNTYEDIDEGF